MRASYEELRAINPNHKMSQVFDKTKTEEQQERMMGKLERQANRMKSNKFDFY